MAVEIAPPVVAPKSNATSGAAGGKSSAKGADKPSADPKNGFMTVLASLDVGGGAALPLTDTQAPSDGALPQDGPVDASLLLSQSLQWGVAPPEISADSIAPQQVGSSLPPAGGVVPTLSAAVPGGGLARGSVAAPASSDLLHAGDSNNASQWEAVLPTVRKAGKGTPDTATLQGAFGMDAANTSQDQTRTELRGRELFAVESAIQSASVADAAVASPVIVLGQREERKSEPGVFKLATVDGVSSHAASPTWVGGGEYTSSGAVDAGMGGGVGVDAFVAEKVSYWISNDVQNAEMKLDGIGDQPVEVSIRMHGNEAHVAFRTDEVMARDVLESASQSLKDMLQKEGVVLSGVSVGTSGSGDPGSQGRNPRQGGRQTDVFAEKPFNAEKRSGGPHDVGRALDLFV